MWWIHKSEYRSAKVTQWVGTLDAAYNGIWDSTLFPNREVFLDHAYTQNVRLMRGGSTMYGRFHNQFLAADLTAASLMFNGDEGDSTGSGLSLPAPEVFSRSVENSEVSIEPDELETWRWHAEERTADLIRGICSANCSFGEIALRRNKTYTSLLFRDNNRKTIARLYYEAPGKARIGLFTPEGKEKKHDIELLEDLQPLARRIRARLKAL